MFTIDKQLLSYKTSLFLKQNKIGRETTSYNKAKKIGILFCVEDRNKHKIVCDFIDKLKADGKKVTVLCFLGKKKENFDFKFDYFSIENLSFWGSLKSKEVNKFIQTDFDFLYSLDLKTNILIDYILAKSLSKCRVGIYNERNKKYFELMVKVDEFKNLQKITDQFLYYTKELINV